MWLPGLQASYLKVQTWRHFTRFAHTSKKFLHSSFLSDSNPSSQVPQIIEKTRRIESRLANDQVPKTRNLLIMNFLSGKELKLSDTLRFHMRDTAAAKDLLYRRLKALAAFEAANKELDLARSRNRDREVAETHQREAWAVFEGVRHS